MSSKWRSLRETSKEQWVWQYQSRYWHLLKCSLSATQTPLKQQRRSLEMRQNVLKKKTFSALLDDFDSGDLFVSTKWQLRPRVSLATKISPHSRLGPQRSPTYGTVETSDGVGGAWGGSALSKAILLGDCLWSPDLNAFLWWRLALFSNQSDRDFPFAGVSVNTLSEFGPENCPFFLGAFQTQRVHLKEKHMMQRECLWGSQTVIAAALSVKGASGSYDAFQPPSFFPATSQKKKNVPAEF